MHSIVIALPAWNLNVGLALLAKWIIIIKPTKWAANFQWKKTKPKKVLSHQTNRSQMEFHLIDFGVAI